MTIDYKKELETAAKSMILVHDPAVLIKMVARTIVHRIKVSHTAILLHEKNKNTYLLDISRGARGLKIPAGFARMDTDNPLIRFFQKRQGNAIFEDGALVSEEARKFLERDIDPSVKQLLSEVLHQMEIFGAEVCIPSYFRDELLGLTLLGKKNDSSKFDLEELSFLIALASDVAMAIRNAQLFKDLESELDKNKRLFIQTTVALAAAIEAKDHYTHGHTTRVTNLCLEIAKKMGEKDKRYADPKFLENLHIASLLHDIGKIGIPESILNKVEPLTEEERKKIRAHPLIGVNILQPIKELEEAIAGVKYHHERYDGSGYPEGLKGHQIPLIAIIISVADAFDAMTTARVYRPALTQDEAAAEIKNLSGKQFHPDIVGVCLELYQEGKI